MAENGSDWVQDYAVIKADRKKGICLCCGGAEEDVLKKIRELTKEVGISVQWISVPMECYLNTLGQLKSYQNDTEIVPGIPAANSNPVSAASSAAFAICASEQPACAVI